MKNKKISGLAEMLDRHKKMIDSLSESNFPEDFIRRARYDHDKLKRDALKKWERYSKKFLADLDAPPKQKSGLPAGGQA